MARQPSTTSCDSTPPASREQNASSERDGHGKVVSVFSRKLYVLIIAMLSFCCIVVAIAGPVNPSDRLFPSRAVSYISSRPPRGVPGTRAMLSCLLSIARAEKM